MNYYFITGTSRGIGKAIAEKLLNDENNMIFGLSRTQSIEHERYRHISIDFNDLEQMKNFQFEPFDSCDKVVLLNNSGVLGDVNYIGKLSSDKIIESYNVNLIAPVLLINKFVKQYSALSATKLVINISSGAAQHVIKSWSTYCSTKSGLEMFARVLNDEMNEVGRKDVKVFSIAPGVVDTQMQTEIRALPNENFSGKDRFVSLKKNNELFSVELVANKLYDVIQSPDDYPELLMDFRD